MAEYPRKTFTTGSGLTYSFIHVPSTKDSAPTLLFLHGFPSHAGDFISQIAYFRAADYSIIIPDLLGYGETSKPDDVQLYRLRSISNDLAALLDSLNVNSVVGIGHDVGANLLSRMAIYYPSRFAALIFLTVGPSKMGTPFDVDKINEMTKSAVGYELLGYIPWLGRDPSAARTLEQNSKSMMSLVFCKDKDIWSEWFRPLGKMKQFVTEGRTVEIGDWYSSDLQRWHLDAFGKEGGYIGATMFYKMWVENLGANDEAGLEARKIMSPVLFVTDGDEMQKGMLMEWVDSLDIKTVQCGHWMHLEKSDETNAAIGDFLRQKQLGA